MGLRKGDGRHAMRWLPGNWALPVAIASAAAICALGADVGREWLRYERAAIAVGQAWRLLTGHLVHLGWSHLALNLVDLILVWYLVNDTLTLKGWVIVILVSVIGIDLGFWFFEPQLEWYVGLSGTLHGLLAAGIVAGWTRTNAESWLLGGALLAKLVYEQLVGPLPGSEASAGGPVVTVAHLYGAIAGGLAAGLYAVRRRPR